MRKERTMPDERLDSIRQGIHAPAESPSGAAAEREREERTAAGPPIGGEMGGTSDSETAGEEADMDAKRSAAEESAGGDGSDEIAPSDER
jgi:hypothetical protein